MHHFCSLDFRVPTRCPGECLWRDPPRPVPRDRRRVLCLEFSVGSRQRAQHEGLSANLITTVFGIEKATMLLIQMRSVFEGPQVRNDAQEGDVSIKITKKQCECRRARLIFAGLRTPGAAGGRVPACGDSFRAVSVYEARMRSRCTVLPRCTDRRRPTRSSERDGGTPTAGSKYDDSVPVASGGPDGSERASVAVWGLPAISRRTKLSEEGDCLLDGSFVTGMHIWSLH